MPRETGTVSIALTTYNGERFLAQQIASLQNQSVLPDEIVICDDLSTDGTIELIERLAATSSIPILLHRNKERLGYRANFMACAGHCSGDLIFFCDQDDIWYEDKLAIVIAAFRDPAVFLVYHNAGLIDEKGDRTGSLYRADEQAAALAQRPIPPWHDSLGFTQALRRSLLAFDDLWPLGRDHKMDELLAHDQWYFLLALAMAGVRYLDQELVGYRQHTANVFGHRPGQRSRLQVLAERLTYKAEERQRLAAHARSLVLARVAARTGSAAFMESPSALAHVREVSLTYQNLAERLKRRQSIYTENSLVGRLAAWLGSMREHDYTGDGGWKSRRAAAGRDLVLGGIAGMGKRSA